MKEDNTGATKNSSWRPLIILGITVFLVPTTLLYLLSVFLGLIAMVAPPSLDTSVLWLWVVLVGGGCGISALWWLVHNYQKISLPDITVRIWVGLVIGMLISAMFVLNHYAVKTPREGWIHFNEFWLWIIFGGPMFVMLALLACMDHRK